MNQSGYQLKLPLELETIIPENDSAPDHATLARFRSIHFAPCSKRILAEVSNLLFDLGEVCGETIFIDGTKIEANANKYKNITADAGYDISKTRKPFTGVRIVANVLTRVITSKVITAKHH